MLSQVVSAEDLLNLCESEFPTVCNLVSQPLNISEAILSIGWKIVSI